MKGSWGALCPSAKQRNFKGANAGPVDAAVLVGKHLAQPSKFIDPAAQPIVGNPHKWHPVLHRTKDGISGVLPLRGDVQMI